MSIPWKAVWAFFAGAVGSFLALTQDKTSFSDLTGFQWMVVVLTAVVLSGGTYVLPK